ncbi:type IV pilin protein [Deinococcus daejeonensis]|uniref:Uncharacterized protein n=1 Tax=Deinococcus daejeonensis TaxID=1007098 RepID=A0ABQ2IZW5_9DEIO|nr:prepilin-type N-terminal cleavage/methylation domain-containing protein [Deinococcus daejeonensis]GGN32198.1 hypothetical protein GCM10010842_08650 [Deinococcus daejeonensis]
MKNTTQGFTLIELLIVIAIIGILAAVLIPNLLGARKRAYDTSAMACARAVMTAAEAKRIDNAAANTGFTGLTAAYVKDFDQKSCADTKLTLTMVAADQTATAYKATVTHADGSQVYTATEGGLSNAPK